MQESRLPELEEALLCYLYRHAGAIKLASQLDTLTQLLVEVLTLTPCHSRTIAM